MWNFGCDGHFIGEQMVTRNLYQDDVFIRVIEEKRLVFASNKGRYIIYMSTQHFLTNDNEFDDRNFTLHLPEYPG